MPLLPPGADTLPSIGIILYIILIYIFSVMQMGQTLVRLDGAQELIVKRLTKSGIFKTKSEVIRAGILALGKELKAFKDLQELEDELAVLKMQKISEEIKQGKRKAYTLEEVEKKYGFK